MGVGNSRELVLLEFWKLGKGPRIWSMNSLEVLFESHLNLATSGYAMLQNRLHVRRLAPAADCQLLSQAVQVELALDVLSWSRLVVIDWLQSRWERDQATARSQRTQRLLGFLQTCFQSGIRLTSKVNISSENKIPWHKNAQLSKLTKSIIKFYQFLLKWNILLNNSQSTGTCLKYLKV